MLASEKALIGGNIANRRNILSSDECIIFNKKATLFHYFEDNFC